MFKRLLSLVLLFLTVASAVADGGFPTPCSTCGGAAAFEAYGNARFVQSGNVGTVSQVGDKSILNWRDFNLSQGNTIIFQQVNDFLNLSPISGARFSVLNRIWDSNPSVIAGHIKAGYGDDGRPQTANLIFINQNGIVFADGAIVDVNTLTASSLNIKDGFFNGSLTPSANLTAQFDGGLDNQPNLGGFVRVLEGAKLTAATGGRIMLIAPSVVNQGDIKAPDGQIVLAAGSKVYLTSSGDPSLRGVIVEVDNANIAGELNVTNTTVPNFVQNPDGTGKTIPLSDGLDKLGHATNLGNLTATKGNITMVGLAVNQMRLASASTSLQANGSIYLLAKTDISKLVINNQETLASVNTGKLTLGKSSVTEIFTEVDDLAKSKEVFTKSKIELVGKEIFVDNDSKIRAQSGVVNISALMDPSKLKSLYPVNNVDLFDTSNLVSTSTNITFESGSLIDVSGLDVIAPIADNYVKIKLLGDELANSPINRNGPLRGKEVWVDLAKGSPLIANIADYQKNIEKTVATGSIEAGQVNLRSLGSIIVRPDVKFDLSGGSVSYSSGQVSETKLFSTDGKVYEISNAPNDIKYESIATQYTKNYDKWGVTEIFNLSQLIYKEGYYEGSNAGSLLLDGNHVFFAGIIDGSVAYDASKSFLAKPPLSAQLQIGSVKFDSSGVVEGFGLNQNVFIGVAPKFLSTTNALLTEEEENSLYLASSIFGKSGVNRVDVKSNKVISISGDLNLLPGSSVKLTAESIIFNADVLVPSGIIEATAFNNITNLLGELNVTLADGVTLSSSGLWINGALNDRVDVASAFIHAGNVKLVSRGINGGNINFGQGAMIDVKGGAYLDTSNKINSGNGGSVSLIANNIKTNESLQTHFSAESMTSGGSINLTTTSIKIGGNISTDDSLNLTSGFFNQGFQNYNLTGLEGIVVSDNSKLRVQSKSLELLPIAMIKPTTSELNKIFDVITQTEYLRKPANISLKATSNNFNPAGTSAPITLGQGSEIKTDIGGQVQISATELINVSGKIIAPAGLITLTLNPSNSDSNPVNRIHLSSEASLIAEGAAKFFFNNKGMRLGEVLSGGTINIIAKSGYIDAELGALIDVKGASPILLDIPTLNGRIGQFVAGNAGSVSIIGNTGVYLDNDFIAKAGSENQSGGTVLIQSGFYDEFNPTKLINSSILKVGNFLNVSPLGLQDISETGLAYVNPSILVSSGFEHIALGGYKILLDGDFSIGKLAGSLGSVKLVAPNIESSGGNVNIKASIIEMGNTFLADQSSAEKPELGLGLLTLVGDLVELQGEFSLSGFNQLRFDTQGDLRLTGMNLGSIPQSIGKLNTAASIEITAGLVTPSTLTAFDISTSSDIRINNTTINASITPLSVMGKLNIFAKNIYQNGRIVAPFGQVLFQASDTLRLGSGSITSVAGAAGTILPLGRTLNGLSWFIDINKDSLVKNEEMIKDIPTKVIKLSAKDIEIMPADITNNITAAAIDIRGGGDIQAWEFSSGPGGTKDLLTLNGYYAVVPSYSSIAAPQDPEPNTSNLRVGQSLYLAGGNGLKAGNYTLLPAKYALLPGAYAVKLTGAIADILPSNSFTKADGTSVIAGFVTDSRFTQSQLSNARWSGFEVLNSDQIKQRSEYTLTLASQFFAKDGISNLPNDAGLLQLDAINSLALNGMFNTAGGNGGKGAAVDINASRFAILDGTTRGGHIIGEVALDIDLLNAINADSLLIGGLRSTSSTGLTSIAVGASKIRINSISSLAKSTSVLTSHELMLVAKDEVNLQNESHISASGQDENLRSYSIEGSSAFVRVASSDANIQHTGSINRTIGQINSSASSKITSSKSVILDSTSQNNFKGALDFSVAGPKVKTSFTVGSDLINFGAIPDGISGLGFDSEKLKLLNGVKNVTLRSYSSFNFYGTSNLGEFDPSDISIANSGFSIENLSLEGGGFRGLGNSSDVVNIQAKSLQISNPEIISVSKNSVSDINSRLLLKSQTLTLGAGNKVITGFANSVVSAIDIIGKNSGSLEFDGDININTALITGLDGANQSITTSKAMLVSKSLDASTLSGMNGLGVRWAFNASSIDFGSQVRAHGGEASLTATGSSAGNLSLLGTAKIDVSGQKVDFFDQSRIAPAGTVYLSSINGNISADAGSELDVSASFGGDAGTIYIIAKGSATMNGYLQGLASAGNKAGSFVLDTTNLSNFSMLNTALNTGGFSNLLDMRVRAADITIAALDTVRAKHVIFSADTGKIDVSGTVDASGFNGGKIEMYAKDNITLKAGGKILALGNVNGLTAGNGGSVLMSSTAGLIKAEVFDMDGITRLANAAQIDVSGGKVGSVSGENGVVTMLAGVTNDFGISSNLAFNPVVTAGTGSVYTASINGFTLTAGAVVAFRPHTINTSASPTLIVSGLLGKPIPIRNGGLSLAIGDLKPNLTYFAVYDGNNFQLVSSTYLMSNPVTTASSVNNAYTATIGGFTSLTAGRVVAFTPHMTNTAAATTLNVSGLGAKEFRKNGGVAIAAGDLVAGNSYFALYDGTNFQLMPQTSLLTSPITTAGPATAYTLDVEGVLTLSPGTAISFTPHINSANSATLNLSRLGAKPINKQSGAVATDDLIAGKTYVAVYDGSAFQLDQTSLLANKPVTTAMTTVGRVNKYTTTTAPIDGFTLAAGGVVAFTPNITNTLAETTLNVFGLGERQFRKNGSTATSTNIAAGDLRQGITYVAVYDGTYFQLASSDVIASAAVGTGINVDKETTGAVNGAREVMMGAVRVYETPSISRAAQLQIAADTQAFSSRSASILDSYRKTKDGLISTLAPNVHIQSTIGALNVSSDWNLYGALPMAGAGVLSLQATGDLTFNGSLSDGVLLGSGTGNTATRDSVGEGDSWSYRLVAGADLTAANSLAVNLNKTGNFVLAENKLIRTGTGSIEIAAGGNFDLGKSSSVNKQTAAIYTLGTEAPALNGFTVADKHIKTESNVGSGMVVPGTLGPQLNNFTHNGGDILIDVKGDIRGAQTDQLYSNWLFWQGSQDADGKFNQDNPQTAWWVRFDRFQQGVATLGGGNVLVKSGGDINNLSVSSVTNGRMSSDGLVVLGGGNVDIRSGSNIAGGQYFVAKGDLNINAINAIKKDTNLYTTIALGDAQANINSNGSLDLQAIINPTMVAQYQTRDISVKSLFSANVYDADKKKSLFSTYTNYSALHAQTLLGDLTLHSGISNLIEAPSKVNMGFKEGYNYQSENLSIIPGNLSAVALSGSISIDGRTIMLPNSLGGLDLLARRNVEINTDLIMSDADPTSLPTASNVGAFYYNRLSLLSLNPHKQNEALHINDDSPARVYAVLGDITKKEDKTSTFMVPKATSLISGRDIVNLNFLGQNIHSDDLTLIKAGRNLLYTNLDGTANQSLSKLKVGGPGTFEIEVGRNLDLGVSEGISTTGDLENPALSRNGASIRIALGVPNGVDYSGAIDRLITKINTAIIDGKPVSDATLWQARWLVGDEKLGGVNSPATLISAVQTIKSLSPQLQSEKVRTMFFTALRDTGRDYNDASSQFGGNYDRGYGTIDLLFPNINELPLIGSETNFEGQLSSYLSSIKTKRGGDIEYLVPGGGALIGLAQISDEQLPNGRRTKDLGVVTIESGSIRGFTLDDMLVNQSRILTVGGGDILLWSSEGNLDAGKGKRTASTVPPPIVKIDANGIATIELQGAATGAGIGAIGQNAGDVDLIAPKGTVNAGDAGVRARNVNIAAQFVFNAGNISASGTTSGTPVADTGALGSALAGASGIGSDAVKSVTENAAKKITPGNMLKPVMPSIINVEVISLGN